MNPKCSKSRGLLALLEERGLPYETRLYLDEKPSRAELQALQQAVGADSIRELMRDKEAAFAEMGLDSADEERLLAAIEEAPVLLERPILVYGGQAVIARPPEQANALLAQIADEV